MKKVFLATLLALTIGAVCWAAASADSCVPLADFRVNTGEWQRVFDNPDPANLCDWLIKSEVGVSNTLTIRLYDGAFALTGDAFHVASTWYGLPNNPEDHTIWAQETGEYVIEGWSYAGCPATRTDRAALLQLVSPAGRSISQVHPTGAAGILPSMCTPTPTVLPTKTAAPTPSATPTYTPAATPTATPTPSVQVIRRLYLPLISKNHVSLGSWQAVVTVNNSTFFVQGGQERVLTLGKGSEVVAILGPNSVFASDGSFGLPNTTLSTSIVFADSLGTYSFFATSGGGLYVGPALPDPQGRANVAIINRRDATRWDKRPLYWLNPSGGPPVLVP